MSETNTTPNFPAQRILFGSPGTGKSHKVHNTYLTQQNGFEPENVFKSNFSISRGMVCNY